MAEGVCMAGKTAIALGGTYPTGMHSCSNLLLWDGEYDCKCSLCLKYFTTIKCMEHP